MPLVLGDHKRGHVGESRTDASTWERGSAGGWLAMGQNASEKPG